MVRTFQVTQPFAGLSVAHNIRVGAFLRHRRVAAAEAVAREIGTRLGLGPMLDRPAGALTVAGRKRLEVARALATGPSLLLLDEVMAGLNPSEINEIVALIRDVRASGVTVLLIEHVMQAVEPARRPGPCPRAGRADRVRHHARDQRRPGRHRSLSRPRRRRPARRMAETLLEVDGVVAGYGAFQVLHGMALDRGGRARWSRCSGRTARARPR